MGGLGARRAKLGTRLVSILLAVWLSSGCGALIAHQRTKKRRAFQWNAGIPARIAGLELVLPVAGAIGVARAEDGTGRRISGALLGIGLGIIAVDIALMRHIIVTRRREREAEAQAPPPPPPAPPSAPPGAGVWPAPNQPLPTATPPDAEPVTPGVPDDPDEPENVPQE